MIVVETRSIVNSKQAVSSSRLASAAAPADMLDLRPAESLLSAPHDWGSTVFPSQTANDLCNAREREGWWRHEGPNQIVQQHEEVERAFGQNFGSNPKNKIAYYKYLSTAVPCCDEACDEALMVMGEAQPMMKK